MGTISKVPVNSHPNSFAAARSLSSPGWFDGTNYAQEPAKADSNYQRPNRYHVVRCHKSFAGLRKCGARAVNAPRESWEGRLESFGVSGWLLERVLVPLKLRTPNSLQVGESSTAIGRQIRMTGAAQQAISLCWGETALVHWQSKKQKTALSSTEAELYAESNASQDIMFENNMLSEVVGDQSIKPSLLKGDNMGAIFLAGNV